MKALVTGGTGFIGSNLALKLAEEGHEVVAIGASHEQKIEHPNIRVIYMGALEIPWDKLGAVDVLFHEGAIADTTIYDKEQMVRANVETSKKFFEYASQHGARKIVYASSCAVYGDLPGIFTEDGPVKPLNAYGESKVMQDEYALEFAKTHPSISVIGMRYSNVYGPRENHKGRMANMIFQLAEQMRKGNPRLFKMGEQMREYIHVDDVVRANMLAVNAKQSGIVNISLNPPRTFNDVVAILNKVMGLTRTPLYIDNPYIGKYQSHIECDVTRAKELFGFSATIGLEEGIQSYFDSGYLAPR